jgi:hypothetical protein
VIIPIRYNSSSNGFTNVRKVIIIRKDTYVKIIKEKNRNAIARVIIDYVMSNKQLFTANIKGDGNVLKIQTSVVRKLLRYIGLDNHYIDTRMGSIVLTVRTLLEVSGYRTELKRAVGRMNSIIYAYEDGGDGNPWVAQPGEKLLNPPAKTEAGEKRDGTKSNLRSNPGPGKVHTGEKEGTNHQELKDSDTRPNGTVGTTSGIHRAMGREGGGGGYDKDENHKGGRQGAKREARGGHK